MLAKQLLFAPLSVWQPSVEEAAVLAVAPAELVWLAGYWTFWPAAVAYELGSMLAVEAAISTFEPA
jgi:hypothetical protein